MDHAEAARSFLYRMDVFEASSRFPSVSRRTFTLLRERSHSRGIQPPLSETAAVLTRRAFCVLNATGTLLQRDGCCSSEALLQRDGCCSIELGVASARWVLWSGAMSWFPQGWGSRGKHLSSSRRLRAVNPGERLHVVPSGETSPKQSGEQNCAEQSG